MSDVRPVVAFDLDDTLYPEADYARSALRAGGAFLDDHFQVHGLGEEAVAAFDAGVDQGLPLDVALRNRGLAASDDLRARLRAHIHRHKPSIKLFDDAAAALDSLTPFARLAVVTEGRVVTQLAKLEALGIVPLFDEIVVTEALGVDVRKSSGEPFAVLRERMGGDTFVFVGDNPLKDAIPAGRHGFHSLTVRRSDCRYIHAAPAQTNAYSSLRDATRVILAHLERERPNKHHTRAKPSES